MQNIGDRIEVNQGKSELLVKIFPKISPRDKLILNIWLVAWTLCGVAVISQLLVGGYSDQEQLFMLIYLVFWVYLELKVLHAYRWNKWGKEIIQLREGKMEYTKEIGKRGLPVIFNVDQSIRFRYVSEVEKGIWNEINKSPWMVGGEVVEFAVEGRVRRLGMKLDAKEGERLANLLNKYVK